MGGSWPRLRRIGRGALAALLRPLGRLVIAERFAAPSELAVIRIPAPPLNPAAGPVRVVLLHPRVCNLRTVLFPSVRPGVDLSLGFPAFANPAGAVLFLLLFQPASLAPVLIRAWQKHAVAAALALRPSITLPCDDEVAGFRALLLRPWPADAMHLLCLVAGPDRHTAPVAGAVTASW